MQQLLLGRGRQAADRLVHVGASCCATVGPYPGHDMVGPCEHVKDEEQIQVLAFHLAGSTAAAWGVGSTM